MEFIEIFKSDERFLTVILGVTQEQVVKLGSFGSVYTDESIVAHTNEEEYNAFANNKETAALLDRLILVRIPYNLRVRDEVRIYAKLLSEGRSPHLASGERHAGIAPLSLHVAAVLSVISRLEVGVRGNDMPRIPLLDKMKLYDGYVLPPYSKDDVERLHESNPREGMFGLSPRYVINRLADVIAREKGCLTPAKTLGSLIEGLEERAGVSKVERDRISFLVPDVIRDYKDRAVREIQRAATEDFHGKAAGLFQSYVLELESFWKAQGGGKGPPQAVDQALLRKVEGALGLRDAERPGFRRDVWASCSYLQQRTDLSGRGYEWIPSLTVAMESLLCPKREELRQALDPRRKDEAGRPGRREISERLVSHHGYCERMRRGLGGLRLVDPPGQGCYLGDRGQAELAIGGSPAGNDRPY